MKNHSSSLIQLPLLCIPLTWLNNWLENGMTPQGAVHCYTSLKLGHKEFSSCSEWTLFVVFRSSNKTAVDIDPKIMIQKCFVEINPSTRFYYSYLLHYLLSQQLFENPPLIAWLWMHMGESSMLHVETEVCLSILASSVEVWQQNPVLRRKRVFCMCKSSVCFCHFTYFFNVFPCALWIVFCNKVVWNPSDALNCQNWIDSFLTGWYNSIQCACCIYTSDFCWQFNCPVKASLKLRSHRCTFFSITFQGGCFKTCLTFCLQWKKIFWRMFHLFLSIQHWTRLTLII